MNKLLLILVSLITFTFLESNNVYSQDSSQQIYSNNVYITDLNLALRLSKETKQDVVLIFSASWCGHCKNLKNDFPTIEGFDNKIVCILDSDQEKKMSRQLKVKSLPTSIILNPEGDEITRKVGYDKVSYSRWLRENN